MTRVGGDWLRSDAVRAVFETFRANEIALYCVGGCVRNALLDVPVADVDMCSAARPERVQQICEAAGFKVIPTGIAHGTVTVLSSGTSFEITTFRKDVATDGRRAVVAFSDEMEEDARRRDFTINALYASEDGTVIDPLGGLADIAARRVRFIDDPEQRIREDYLRILRFFRFHARFAAEAPDVDTLDAIARNLDGLDHVSVERITVELLNLLAVPDPAPAIGLMQQTGVLGVILPGADPRALAPFVHVEGLLSQDPDPVARLAALAGGEVLDRLRLSKAQVRQISEIQDGAMSSHAPAALGATLGASAGMQAVALRSALSGTPPPDDAAARVAWGAAQRFPLSAADLQPDYQGPALGQRLEELRQVWLASELTLSKDALLCQPKD